jgi:hypothetical protein
VPNETYLWQDKEGAQVGKPRPEAARLSAATIVEVRKVAANTSEQDNQP